MWHISQGTVSKENWFDLPDHLNCYHLKYTLHIYSFNNFWYELLLLSSVTVKPYDLCLLRQWKIQPIWQGSAQTARWFDFCSTNKTLGWTLVPLCPSPTTTGTSAQQRKTTSRWECAWRTPDATETSTSSCQVKQLRVRPDPLKTEVWILISVNYTALKIFFTQKNQPKICNLYFFKPLWLNNFSMF